MQLENKITTDDRQKRIDEFIKDIQQFKNLSKYLKQDTWISGSSTVVYPITVWLNDIKLQLTIDTSKPLRYFMQKYKNKYPDLIRDVIFWKSDGSCPSTITFLL